MLKRNKILLNVTLGAIIGFSTSIVLAEGLDKCGKCKPKNTLQLMNHTLAENDTDSQTTTNSNPYPNNDNSQKDSNKIPTNNGGKKQSSNDDSQKTSYDIGKEKGSDRENDMNSGD